MSHVSSCRLCPLLDPPAWPPYAAGTIDAESYRSLASVRGHDTNFHKVRDCDQMVYTSVDAFVRHLRDEHNAWFPKSQPDLSPWQRVQVLEVPSVNRTVDLSQHMTSHKCCEVLDLAYTFATVSFDD